LGSTLIFGSPDHHNTSSKVESVNWVVADLLRAFANDRQDDWPLLTPLVEFAINDAASPLGTGFTPFYADRGQHPQRPLTPPSQGRPAEARGWEAVARLMEQVTTEVRALLQERQDARKARLDPGRRDVQFVPGDLVLLDFDRIPLPSRGLLSPRWQGLFFDRGSDGSEHIQAYLASGVEGGERVQRVSVALIPHTPGMDGAGAARAPSGGRPSERGTGA